jgi:hypothetical protein
VTAPVSGEISVRLRPGDFTLLRERATVRQMPTGSYVANLVSPPVRWSVVSCPAVLTHRRAALHCKAFAIAQGSGSASRLNVLNAELQHLDTVNGLPMAATSRLVALSAVNPCLLAEGRKRSRRSNRLNSAGRLNENGAHRGGPLVALCSSLLRVTLQSCITVKEYRM